MDWRIPICGGAIHLPNARQRDVSRNIKILKYIAETRQDISKSRKVARGGLRQHESPGMTARASANGLGFKDSNRLRRIQPAQFGGGR